MNFIPYVVLLIILGVLSVIYEIKKEDINSWKISMGGFVLFFLFFGFRGFVGYDWGNYFPEFEKITFYDLVSFDGYSNKSHEPGWILFMLLNKSIVDSYHFMLFNLTLLETFLLYRFLKRYSSNVLLALTIMIAFEGISSMFNLLRNMPAILIFLNSIQYIEQRKIVPYILFCLLACSFHFSSVVFLPLYFVLNISFNKWVYMAVVSVCFIIFIFHIPVVLTLIKVFHIGGDFLEEKIEVYMELLGSRGFGMGFLERLLTSTLIFCYYDKLKKLKKENVIFINVFILYMMVLSLLSEFDEIAKRFSALFVFAYWILWPDLIKCFHYPNNRLLFKLFIGLYCIIRVATTTNQAVMEYDNLLMGSIKPYPERKFVLDRMNERPEL